MQTLYLNIAELNSIEKAFSFVIKIEIFYFELKTPTLQLLLQTPKV